MRRISRRRQMLEESKLQKDAFENLRQINWDESRATLRVDLKNVSNFKDLLDQEREKDERKKEKEKEKELIEKGHLLAKASSQVDALLEKEGFASSPSSPRLGLGLVDGGAYPLNKLLDSSSSSAESLPQLVPTKDPTEKTEKCDLGQTLLVTPPTATEAIRQSSRGEEAAVGFSIVLKLTTFSADEVTAFELTGSNAVIGRGIQNTVSIPEDVTMDEVCHAEIFFKDNDFFLKHGTGANGTFVRLKPSSSSCSVYGEQAHSLRLEWPLLQDTVFKVGTTEFKVISVEESSGAQTSLRVVGIEGKLKGKEYDIRPPGISIGRSNDNGISTGDGEVSRRHAQIKYCKHGQRFMLRDLSSTNGTYIRLCGPNQGVHTLRINDEIMVARTCMSVNRHDAASAETKGRRSTMEDEKHIEQDLHVEAFNELQARISAQKEKESETQCRVVPQSYFAVYDGHGGNDCSKFLALELHNYIRDQLEQDVKDFCAALDSNAQEPVDVDKLVVNALKKAFAEADAAFLNKSESTAGSTAITALLVGRRLYVSNVGDSRCVLCRGTQAVPLSIDHKPHLESETERIKKAGGFVLNKRVMGELAVSRAFGDRWLKVFEKSDDDEGDKDNGIEMEGTPGEGEGDGWICELKESLVISEPEIQITDIGPDDHFIILACDGLYDVMTSQEAVNFVYAQLADHNDMAIAAQHLVDEAVRKRSRDNVTVSLVRLNGASLHNGVFKAQNLACQDPE